MTVKGTDSYTAYTHRQTGSQKKTNNKNTHKQTDRQADRKNCNLIQTRISRGMHQGGWMRMRELEKEREWVKMVP